MKADKEDSGPRRKSGETPRQSRTDFLRSQIFECGPAQPFINLSGLSCSLITQRVSNPGSRLERAGFSATPTCRAVAKPSRLQCKACNAGIPKAVRRSLTLLRPSKSAPRLAKEDRL